METMKDTWTHRYEQLRHDALKSGRKSAGLALLMRQGVLGWMSAWRTLAPGTPTRPTPPSARIDVRTELNEIVTVMAGMFLAGPLEAFV